MTHPLLISSILFLSLVSSTDCRVHVVPHSHLDMGWLSTIDRYYDDSVGRIFDSVIDALTDSRYRSNPKTKRKFTINDLGYFRMWIEHDKSTKAVKLKIVNELIEEGVLELIGNGLVMADTACPHYEDFISNFFEGIAFTEQNFNVRSQTVWQLDSFGQSYGLFYIASLFRIHDAVFQRIVHKIRDQLAGINGNEFIWALPNGRSINVHLLGGYAWDQFMDADIFSTINSHQLEMFIEKRAKGFKGDSLMLLGHDFAWMNAGKQFSVFEKSLEESSQWSGYSTMCEFLDAFYAKEEKLPVVSGDFLPYIDEETYSDTWTGYFTSKPLLKFKIRRLNKLQRALNVWVSCKYSEYVQMKSPPWKAIDALIEVSGTVPLSLHHDAITGTSTREVDSDYLVRIDLLETQMVEVLNAVASNNFYSCDFMTDFLAISNCFFLNEALKTSTPIEAIVINPTGRLVRRRLQLAIARSALQNTILIFTDNEVTTPSQAVCFDSEGMCLLNFELDIPAANGYKKFWIISREESSIDKSLKIRSQISEAEGHLNPEITEVAKGEDKHLRVDKVRERVVVPGKKLFGKVFVYLEASRLSIVLLEEVRMFIDFEIVIRKAEYGNAYTTKFNEWTNFDIYGENKYFQTYESTLDEWGVIVHNTRATFWVFKARGKDWFEVKLLIGWDTLMNMGFEFALRITRHDLPMESEFWVESNGLFEVQRKNTGTQNKNIYPTTTKASLRDPVSHKGMSVWTDRCRGVMTKGNQLFYGIQRSGSSGKGLYENLQFYEDTFSHFYIHNFDDKSENDTDLALRNIADVDTPIFFSKQKPGPSFGDVEYKEWEAKERLGLSQSIRWTVSIASKEQLVVRIQNVNRQNVTEFQAEEFFRVFYKGMKVKEVGFHYVTKMDVTSEKEVKEKYVMKPLEFRTFLVYGILV